MPTASTTFPILIVIVLYRYPLGSGPNGQYFHRVSERSGLLFQFRPLAVPVGAVLELFTHGQQDILRKCGSHKLDRHRQAIRETARKGERGKAGQVARGNQRAQAGVFWLGLVPGAAVERLAGLGCGSETAWR